jgi:hypothetical protein
MFSIPTLVDPSFGRVAGPAHQGRWVPRLTDSPPPPPNTGNRTAQDAAAHKPQLVRPTVAFLPPPPPHEADHPKTGAILPRNGSSPSVANSLRFELEETGHEAGMKSENNRSVSTDKTTKARDQLGFFCKL